MFSKDEIKSIFASATTSGIFTLTYLVLLNDHQAAILATLIVAISIFYSLLRGKSKLSIRVFLNCTLIAIVWVAGVHGFLGLGCVVALSIIFADI